MNINSEQYFDHGADIGIIGRGDSIEAAFIDAAKAMFAIMGDLNEIQPIETIDLEFEEEDIELALVTYLNQLLAKAQSEHLLLSKFELQRENNHWQGRAWGEKWRDDMTRGTEVKGATLTMLKVTKINQTWEARCVVDV